MNSPNHSSGLQALETIEAATENVCRMFARMVKVFEKHL